MENTALTGNRGSGVLIFLAGMGAGIALTGLLAPRSGASTRRLISRKVDEGTGWMKDKATAAQDFVRSQTEELRDRVRDVAEVIGRS